MADAPERIWNAARVEELSTRLRDRAEVARSEPTMTARCDADHFIEAADAIEALFIRADLVDELVKALEGIHNTWPGTPQGNAAADALTRIKGDGK